MRKSEFVEALESLGACEEGLELAKKQSGRVTTIARKWAKPRGRNAPTKRGYFEWLAESVKGEYSETYSPVDQKTYNELLRVVRLADPTFRTYTEESEVIVEETRANRTRR